MNAQGEYLDAYLIDGTEPPPRVVFIDPDPADPDDPNGALGAGHAGSGRGGSFYVPEPSRLRVTRFSPPFPQSAADCDNPRRLVTVPPSTSVFLDVGTNGLVTPREHRPRADRRPRVRRHVLLPKIVNEYDALGAFVRTIVPDGMPDNPLGIDVGADGTAYYAELNLDPDTNSPRCGSVSRVRFDAKGDSAPPRAALAVPALPRRRHRRRLRAAAGQARPPARRLTGPTRSIAAASEPPQVRVSTSAMVNSTRMANHANPAATTIRVSRDASRTSMK